MKALLVDYLTSSSKLSFNLESFLFSMRISKVYALFQHSNFGGLLRAKPLKKTIRHQKDAFFLEKLWHFSSLLTIIEDTKIAQGFLCPMLKRSKTL